MDSAEQEGRRLILEGYSDQFVGMANRCTTWLYWHVPFSGTRRKILNSGTVFFVDLGSGPFGITAAHVVNALFRDKGAFSDLVCQIGNLEIDPLERLLGRGRSRDLATFKVTSQELAKLGLAPHVDPGPWPPRTPQEGKGAFFGGFRLGEGSELDLRKPYPFDFWNGFGAITGIYDQQIKMHFEREHWVHRPNHKVPPPGAEWGGVSGGPFFALFENPVVFYQLVGVLSEYSETMELLIPTPARFIANNGSIRA